ncbi:MAG: hypothetical protein HKO01_01010 [Flaviramulus sp.]|nr:hypothetical protein [Flaviramulus sp.]NNC49100.1 hypothetical protein [Flaviramulus sp.]
MKNFVIGLFVIGLTTLGFSQQRKGNVESVILKDVLVTHTKSDVPIMNVNFSYINEVQNKTTAKYVKSLESVASRYNVMESPTFDGRDEPFKTIFRGTKGYIIATYDSNGKILTTQERYRDVKLPKKLVKSVLKEFPESHFLKAVHYISYNHKRDLKKTYRIKIMNDDQKKNLRITADASDNLLSMVIEK